MSVMERACIKSRSGLRCELSATQGTPVAGGDGGELAVVLRVGRIGWTSKGSMTMRSGEDEIEFGLPLLVGFVMPAGDAEPPLMMRFDTFEPGIAAALVGPVDPGKSSGMRSEAVGVIYRVGDRGGRTVTAIAFEGCEADALDPDSLPIGVGDVECTVEIAGVVAALATASLTK